MAPEFSSPLEARRTGEHGFYDKRLILDGSLRMPFLVRYPAEIEAGSKSSAISLNVDFAKTFLDYGGASAPKSMQGRSLRQVFNGHTPRDWRTASFYAYYASPSHYGVRGEKYTYLKGGGGVEFYDHKSDPYQNMNVSDNPRHKKKIKEAQKVLRNLMKEVDISEDELPNLKEKGKKTRKRKKGDST